MGIDSKVDDNPAMILGGLERGVTPLEMAYAYSTLANGGNKISGTMASRGIGKGPVAIESVKDENGKPVEDNLGATGENKEVDDQVLDPDVAQQAKDILHTVVTSGTGKNAQVGDDYIFGKTGTTDDNIDAWFVGANEEITVAVWVGYLDGATPMDDRIQRRSGGRRHDPGPDLARHRHRLGRPAGRRAWPTKKAKKAGDEAPTTTVGTVDDAPAPAPVAPAPVPEAPVEQTPVTPEPAPVEPAPGTDGAVEGGAAVPGGQG